MFLYFIDHNADGLICVIHWCVIFIFSSNVIKSCLAGYDSDYLFDWTILKYQQMQQEKTQSQPPVSSFLGLVFKITIVNELLL